MLQLFLDKSFRLSRTITARSVKSVGVTAEGVATFTSIPNLPNHLLYEEQVDVAFQTQASNASPTKGTQRYIWKFGTQEECNANSVSIYFVVRGSSPPRIDYLFLDLDFTKDRTASAIHPCVDDMYNAGYDLSGLFDGRGTFSITYDVSGPQKDYLSFTTYAAMQ